jgi:hypothetical protein
MSDSQDTAPQQSDIAIPDVPNERVDDSWLGEHPGDTIIGTVTKRETIAPKKLDGKTGEPLPPFVKLWLDQGNDDERGVPCFRRDLRDFIDLQEPEVGDRVAIKYFGPAPDGFGHRYGTSIVKAHPASDIPSNGFPPAAKPEDDGDDPVPF